MQDIVKRALLWSALSSSEINWSNDLEALTTVICKGGHARYWSRRDTAGRFQQQSRGKTGMSSLTFRFLVAFLLAACWLKPGWKQMLKWTWRRIRLICKTLDCIWKTVEPEWKLSCNNWELNPDVLLMQPVDVVFGAKHRRSCAGTHALC